MMADVRKKLARDPYIRALGMRVYPHTPRSMIVVGGAVPHEVFAFSNRLKCDCPAAQYGRFCAHVAAIEHAQQLTDNGKDIMSQFVLDRSSAERGTPVELPRKQTMLYAGLFSTWFLHEGQYGISVGVKTLVTHVASGKSWEKLDAITEAMTFVNPKWYFNTKKNQASHLMQIVRSLTGASYEKLDPLSTDEVKEILNRNVGTGILFAASVNDKGQNAIDKDSFDMADAAFGPLAQSMNSKIEVKQTKDGLSYIAKPEPTYQPTTAAGATSGVSTDDLSGEVPF